MLWSRIVGIRLLRAPDSVTPDQVSCRASEDVVIRAGEEVVVNGACSAVVTNEECATCFVSLVKGMEVCQGGDPDVKDDRREAYSCTGNGTKDLCLLLKNVSGVEM